MELHTQLVRTIRTIPDFPHVGVQFKDISPIFLQPKLCRDIAEALAKNYEGKIDAICAIESRGFFMGILLAQVLGVSLFPVRKKGKLPGAVRSVCYALEYGTATLEIQQGIVKQNWRVMIHDDLLATGGTAAAAAQLVQAEGGIVSGFTFIAELNILNGREKILSYASNEQGILSLITF